MIGVRPAGLVPIAFVDGDHFAGVAGDAAVGKEVRRVGEDEVDGGFGDGGEDLEAVALEEAEVVFGVVEGGSGEMRMRRAILRKRGTGGAVGLIVDEFGQCADRASAQP